MELARGEARWLVLDDANAQTATWMHHIERERDPSHVKDLSAAEWRAALGSAGFRIAREATSVVALQLPDWAERAGVERDAIEALRGKLLGAPGYAASAFGIERQGDGSIDFHWDVLALVAAKA